MQSRHAKTTPPPPNCATSLKRLCNNIHKPSFFFIHSSRKLSAYFPLCFQRLRNSPACTVWSFSSYYHRTNIGWEIFYKPWSNDIGGNLNLNLNLICCSSLRLSVVLDVPATLSPPVLKYFKHNCFMYHLVNGLGQGRIAFVVCHRALNLERPHP